MRKKVIDIALDIETLSCRSDAAIISIAAVPFKLDGEYVDMQPFYEVINATSCALYGMHFDEKTVSFWAEQSPEAKAEFFAHPAVGIREAMESFVGYVESIKSKYDCEVHIWSQGIDFDIPKVHNAIRKALSVEELPWKYNQVRDARTFLLELLQMYAGCCFIEMPENPYDLLPKREEEFIEHSALCDAQRMAENVQWVYGEVISLMGEGFRSFGNKAVK